jgi:hypothetical protein
MTQEEATDLNTRKNLFDVRIVPIVEICLAGALSLTWIIFHLRFFLHAGGLWRDEVNSVNLANSPTLAELWRNIEYDSFPILWHLVLRAWIHTGIGSTDAGLRLLGLLTGLGILGILWLNARRFRLPPPIVAIALLGFTSAITCYGDSIRAYGLGVLLQLLTFGLIWEVVIRPSPLRVTGAFLAALCSVHMLFYNAPILAAICAAAIVVCALNRHWKRAALVGAIGVASALSTLIYLPEIHRRDSWGKMFFHHTDLAWVRSNFYEAVGYDVANPTQTTTLNGMTWEFAAISALFLGTIVSLTDRQLLQDRFRKQVLIFHLLTFCLGAAAYWWFLKRLNYVLQPWYYLALLALLATCADALLVCIPKPKFRLAVFLATILLCVTTARAVWFDTGLRRSNIEPTSVALSTESHPGDIVVVSPWFYATTLDRYFKGPADLVPVPSMNFLAYQKFDLLVPWMDNPAAIEPTLSRISETLKTGHSVYLLGNFGLPTLGTTTRPSTKPSAGAPFGWDINKDYDLWSDEIYAYLSTHASTFTRLDVQRANVSAYERPGVIRFTGWTDPPQSRPAHSPRPD